MEKLLTDQVLPESVPCQGREPMGQTHIMRKFVLGRNHVDRSASAAQAFHFHVLPQGVPEPRPTSSASPRPLIHALGHVCPPQPPPRLHCKLFKGPLAPTGSLTELSLSLLPQKQIREEDKSPPPSSPPPLFSVIPGGFIKQLVRETEKESKEARLKKEAVLASPEQEVSGPPGRGLGASQHLPSCPMDPLSHSPSCLFSCSPGLEECRFFS